MCGPCCNPYTLLLAMYMERGWHFWSLVWLYRLFTILSTFITSELLSTAYQVGSPSNCTRVSSVHWPRKRLKADSRFDLSLLQHLTYSETLTLKISLSMSMEFVASISSGSIIFCFSLSRIHQTYQPFMYYLPMYSEILCFTCVKQSAHVLS